METIYSLVTKPINQNVAIIRLSGPETFNVVKDLIPSFEIKHNNILYTELNFDNEFIDQAIVLSFIGPNSFTGEDVVEIQSHGNMHVVKKILNKLSEYNIKQSEPGEFMKQAFVNNKMDLSQSEAINTLILSEDKLMSERSKMNLSGKQTEVINNVIVKLSKIIANIQVSIDYPENQDMPTYSSEGILKELKEYKTEMENIIKNSKSLIKISKGFKIALIGKPNAGKSSLMNALLNEERAIVSNVEGTTRDVVESSLLINDVKVTIQDTAGIRETDDFVEQLGIDKTFKTLDEADIVVSIEEPSNMMDYSSLEKYKDKIIKVMNKNDLEENSKPEYISISAINGDISLLVEKLSEHINLKLNDTDLDNAMLITNNQVNNFEKVLDNINQSISMLQDGIEIDVIAFEIENAARNLGNMIGSRIDQEYIRNLFSSFCLGK